LTLMNPHPRRPFVAQCDSLAHKIEGHWKNHRCQKSAEASLANFLTVLKETP